MVIIRSGITDNSFMGIPEGPVDLFSTEFIILSISSLDMSNHNIYLVVIMQKSRW